MVESADLREGGHIPQFGRLDRARLRTVVLKRLVSPGLVVVGDVFVKNAPEMLLVPLDAVTGLPNQVPLDSDTVKAAREMGICLGD